MHLGEALLANWFPLHKKPPGHLFHYTTIEGLLGILRENRLWATHVAYLNDPSELTHAHDLIQEELASRMSATESSIDREFIGRAQRAINPHDGMQQYFAACFCEKSDLLSQWRAYSNRDGGYALGFATRQMERVAMPSPTLALRRVIYDHDTQRTLVANTLDATLAKLGELSSGMDLQSATSLIATLVSFLRDHLAEFHFSFKNQAFAEEREWRLVFMSQVWQRETLFEQLKFRPGHGSPIPYVSVDFADTVGPNASRLPLEHVVFGPTLDVHLAGRSLGLLLNTAGYASTEVASSSVPLRY
jgi:hypothetical protein